MLELRSKIADEARTEMSKEQREYLLRQQMRAIQQELGEKNPEQAEIELLKERLEEAELPDEIRKEAERELNRLERLPSAVAGPPRPAHLPRARARAALEGSDRGQPRHRPRAGRSSTRTTTT